MRAPSMSTISNVKPFHSTFRLFGDVGQAGRGQAADCVVGVVQEDLFDAECGEVLPGALSVHEALPSSHGHIEGRALRGVGARRRGFEDVFQGDDARVTPNRRR